MKGMLAAIVAVMALVSLPADEASAHGPGFSSRIGIGVGIGLGYGTRFGYPYVRPYRAFPGSYVGISVWPRTLTRRAGTRERTGGSGAEQLYVYPAAGQSEQQLSSDRYDCHIWSVNQTSFDPTLGAGTREQAQQYARAITACLEARSYVVR